MNRPFSINY